MLDAPLTYTLIDGQKPGTQILKLEGPLTLTTMFPLQEQLRTITPPTLIMDMTGVPYMDSAGIGLLPNYHIAAQRDGRALLLAGLNHRLQALLDHTRLNTILKTFPSVEEAEASS
jgi:anti-sigma B factor antagonist